MTENKRFTIKPQDDLFGVEDNYSADKVCVINSICTEIEAEWLCKTMNTLNDENEQLKRVIAEDEKLIQSAYDELTKLRCIKKNLGRIKTQWDWIMEAIQYD